VLSKPRAERLAWKLDVDLERGICLASLSFVSFALEGNPAKLSGQVTRMTTYLSEDGLSAQALEAVRLARGACVLDAAAALVDLERRGGRSATARAIVRRLAARAAAPEARARSASACRPGVELTWGAGLFASAISSAASRTSTFSKTRAAA